MTKSQRYCSVQEGGVFQIATFIIINIKTFNPLFVLENTGWLELEV